jgi:protein associated with RNAse G/E
MYYNSMVIQKLINSRFLFPLLLLVIFKSFPQGTWTWRSQGHENSKLYALTWTGTMFVAAGTQGVMGGQSHIFVSTDGITWVDREYPVNECYFYSVAGNRDTIVAVVDSGPNGKLRMVISSNGAETWNNVWKSSSFSERVRNIVYDGNQYVAVGDSMDLRNIRHGRIMTSPDGINWTNRTSGTEYALSAVTYGEGKYVAVGDFGTILSSADNGITWSDHSFTADKIYDISYGANTFAAISDTVVFLSSDGNSWVRKGTGLRIRSESSIIYGGNQFVIAPNDSVVYSSPDAVSWTRHSLGRSAYFCKVAYANNLYVIVGDSSLIYTSPVITPVFNQIDVFSLKNRMILFKENRLSYFLSSSSPVTCKLYTLTGRQSISLVNSNQQQPGAYSISVPSSICPGAYVLGFQAGNLRENKMIKIDR